MALTDQEKGRITAIEKMINDLQIAVNNCAAKAQLRQLLTLKQQEIKELQDRVACLESQISVLQKEGI